MLESLQTKKPQTKAELISHWRSTANEIRSEIASAGLNGETEKIAQVNANMLDACANQLEALPKD